MNAEMYIGKSKNPNKRFYSHVYNAFNQKNQSDGKEDCPRFYEAIRNFGKHNFKLEVIEDQIIEESFAYNREKYWIEFYNSTELGYNMLLGDIRNGLSGCDNPTYGLKKTPEQIENLRNYSTGSNNPFFGKNHKEESKTKMSINGKGKGKGGNGKSKHKYELTYLFTNEQFYFISLSDFCNENYIKFGFESSEKMRSSIRSELKNNMNLKWKVSRKLIYKEKN